MGTAGEVTLNDDSRRVFLSHNKADKAVARETGALLLVRGADVWLDEWEIAPGDSIPKALDAGLAAFDVLAVFWSEHAAKSRWVRGEIDAALMRVMSEPGIRIIPCLLDDTPLPPLISPYKGLDFSDPPVGAEDLVNAVLGTYNRRARLLAIQRTIDSIDVNWQLHPMFPPMACCPRCGAEGDTLEPWTQTDYGRDDQYAGLKCPECGWNDGGEI